MELRQLDHFVRVAERGSFTAAAQEVRIVQSALSTSIRNLERELGAALFERTTRRVLLTEAGRALLPTARRMLADASTAREQIASVAGVHSGHLAVGTMQTLTAVDLPAELASFHRAHPGVQITVWDALVSELLDAVVAGELDLAYVAPEEPLPKGLTSFTEWREELVLATSPDHPMSGSASVDLCDLDDEPFVMCRAGMGLEIAISRLVAQCQLEKRIACRVTQMSVLVDLVRHGIGVAILPRPLVEAAGLPCVPLIQEGAERTVMLIARSPEPVNPAAVSLLNHLTITDH